MGMKLAGVMFLVMCVMGGIGYWYYNDTQERMAILQENNAKLEIAVETNEAALESLEASYASAQDELSSLNAMRATSFNPSSCISLGVISVVV